MRKIFTYCFDKWWRPILFWSLGFGLVVSNEIVEASHFGNIGYWILCFALLGLIVSTIYQLLKRHWLKAILTGLLFCGTIGAFIIYGLLLFFIESVDGDKWADNLTIPDNIELHIPKGNGFQTRPDTIITKERTAIDFELYNSFQPGLYEYDLWTGKIESGSIYLKAFEITQEYPLSTDRLPGSSSIKIHNPTEDIVKFGTTSHLTIYEGDWGKPYAARFEVWFKPDKGGQEKKLIEKIYKTEGWQR